ncbi:MAG: hypothetical protein IJM96_07895 [Clostridia bacterium]|nr:hypothetical protein [Clostridia bacterium]
MLSNMEAMLVRVIRMRMARGESLENILASYKNLDEETKERVLVYVEYN